MPETLVSKTQSTDEPWKKAIPIDDGDDTVLIFLCLIVGVPWFIGVLAILGGIVWCGLHA